MLIALFCNGRDSLSIPREAAKWLLCWLPQRYKLNRELYSEIKKSLKESDGNDVNLSGNLCNSMVFRTHPVFIEALDKFHIENYKISEADCNYFYIKNLGTKKEKLVKQETSRFIKSLVQEINTYFW